MHVAPRQQTPPHGLGVQPVLSPRYVLPDVQPAEPVVETLQTFVVEQQAPTIAPWTLITNGVPVKLAARRMYVPVAVALNDSVVGFWLAAMQPSSLPAQAV